MELDRLRPLHQEFLLEPDPAKKHKILGELLTLVQEYWIHFVGLAAAEEDPTRLQSWVDDLDKILEAWRTRSATPMQIRPSDLPLKGSGTERVG